MRGEVVSDEMKPKPQQPEKKPDVEYDSDGNEIKDNFKRLQRILEANIKPFNRG